MQATVSEIHAHPLRPEGFAEPLFHTAGSRRRIMEHLAESSWLWRASEAPRPGAGDGEKRGDGEVLASWREVDRWWTEDGGVDRRCYLLRTAGGGEVVRTRPPRRV